MEGLLKWSIAAQNGDKTSQPDPKALSQLLGAPDDLTLMKNEMQAAVESKDRDARIEYLEQFEEHVENVDNANNIGKLWEPLLYLAKDEDLEVRALALSSVAAAVQNNDKSQADLVTTKSGIPTILESVTNDNVLVSTKALLALSCAIAHCQAAYDQFTSAKGWDVLASLLNLCSSGQAVPDKKKARVMSLVYSIVLLLPHTEIYDELERLQVQKQLEELKPKESGVTAEKIDDILSILKEHPRGPIKLLSQ